MCSDDGSASLVFTFDDNSCRGLHMSEDTP
jgi:hypothetical protein